MVSLIYIAQILKYTPLLGLSQQICTDNGNKLTQIKIKINDPKYQLKHDLHFELIVTKKIQDKLEKRMHKYSEIQSNINIAKANSYKQELKNKTQKMQENDTIKFNMREIILMQQLIEINIETRKNTKKYYKEYNSSQLKMGNVKKVNIKRESQHKIILMMGDFIPNVGCKNLSDA